MTLMLSFPHSLFCKDHPPNVLYLHWYLWTQITLCAFPLHFSLALTLKEHQENSSSMRWNCFHVVCAAMAFSSPNVSWDAPEVVSSNSSHFYTGSGTSFSRITDFPLYKCLNGGLVYLNPWETPLSESPFTLGMWHWGQASLKCSSAFPYYGTHLRFSLYSSRFILVLSSRVPSPVQECLALLLWDCLGTSWWDYMTRNKRAGRAPRSHNALWG